MFFVLLWLVIIVVEIFALLFCRNKAKRIETELVEVTPTSVEQLSAYLKRYDRFRFWIHCVSFLVGSMCAAIGIELIFLYNLINSH